VEDYREALTPGVRVHLIGIGGVSMCALAEVLQGKGLRVQGSDIADSPATERLRELGIPVALGHRAENLGDAELGVRTAACRDDNPEVIALRERGVPLLERAEAWGALMRDVREAVCLSGTHGKTTATSMMTHVAMRAGLDPTVMIGGTLPLIGAGHRVGTSGLMVMESCEYCNSFLNFFPTVAAILNVEADHLDFFRDLDEVIASFRAFALRVPEDRGVVVYNQDDPGARRAVQDLPRRRISFGLTDGADFQAVDLAGERGLYAFTVRHGGGEYARVSLQAPGLHNVSNALCVCACAHSLGIPGDVCAEGLRQFTGAARRFERKGVYRGADVVDDYAHHPGEITATLTAARAMGYRRVICAFQPHTYTRTAALFGDFAEALKLADVALVTEIYAARERNPGGMTAQTLAAAVPGALFCPSLPEMTAKLRELASPGDLILTMGAGDVVKAGEALLSDPKHEL
jgi:UDP-N-acetylmuramate--alanine ligase